MDAILVHMQSMQLRIALPVSILKRYFRGRRTSMYISSAHGKVPCSIQAHLIFFRIKGRGVINLVRGCSTWSRIYRFNMLLSSRPRPRRVSGEIHAGICYTKRPVLMDYIIHQTRIRSRFRWEARRSHTFLQPSRWGGRTRG